MRGEGVKRERITEIVPLLSSAKAGWVWTLRDCSLEGFPKGPADEVEKEKGKKKGKK